MATKLIKTVFADIPPGAIIRHLGSWGVVCKRGVVDFWDHPRQKVRPWEVVEVLIEK